MPQGDKSSYTDRQKRQAAHIEESYEDRGVSKNEAESRAWATVNKQDGGGKKSGSGRETAQKAATKKSSASKSTTEKSSGNKPPAKRARKESARQRSRS